MCRACARTYINNWQRDNASRKQGHYLKYRYGLTLAAYDDMCTAQQFKCAACGAEEKLVVDHDHATGAVRGLLCNSCNVALGLLGDTSSRAIKLAAYASKHGK